MKAWMTITLAGVVALAAAAGLIVGVYGIWPPDMDGRKLTIVSATTPDGTQLRAEQYWNHVDFYSTLLYVTAPGGKTIEYVIDGDDRKQWRGEFQMTATSARLMFGSEEQGIYELKTRKFFKGRAECEGRALP